MLALAVVPGLKLTEALKFKNSGFVSLHLTSLRRHAILQSCINLADFL
jgi:hypothetical protein